MLQVTKETSSVCSEDTSQVTLELRFQSTDYHRSALFLPSLAPFPSVLSKCPVPLQLSPLRFNCPRSALAVPVPLQLSPVPLELLLFRSTCPRTLFCLRTPSSPLHPNPAAVGRQGLFPTSTQTSSCPAFLPRPLCRSRVAGAC